MTETAYPVDSTPHRVNCPVTMQPLLMEEGTVVLGKCTNTQRWIKARRIPRRLFLWACTQTKMAIYVTSQYLRGLWWWLANWSLMLVPLDWTANPGWRLTSWCQSSCWTAGLGWWLANWRGLITDLFCRLVSMANSNLTKDESQ
jgi:hypothetical protein